MNDKPSSDRLTRVAPLVLRWGLAAILIYSGVQYLAPLAGTEEGGQAVQAGSEGVSLSFDWGDLLAVGSLGVGGLLVVGFLTRLIALAVLGIVAYGGVLASGHAGLGPAGLAGQFSDFGAVALMFLAAACASLLVSGSGCLGLDRRIARRRAKRTDAAVG